MRIASLILAVAACTLLLLSTGAQEGKPESQKPVDKANKVEQLQQERIAALKTVVEVETELYKSGNASPEAVQEARIVVCEAEVDAAENEADRVAALKSLVELL